MLRSAHFKRAEKASNISNSCLKEAVRLGEKTEQKNYPDAIPDGLVDLRFTEVNLATEIDSLIEQILEERKTSITKLLSINEVYYIKAHDEHRGHAIDNGSAPAVAPIVESHADRLKIIVTKCKFAAKKSDHVVKRKIRTLTYR